MHRLFAALALSLTAVKAWAPASAEAATEATGAHADPLHVAVAKGDLEEVLALALASAGQDLNRRTTSVLYAPIHVAAYFGRADVVGVLANHGADLDATSRDGSAVYVAAHNGHAGVIELMLDACARQAADAADGTDAVLKEGHMARVLAETDLAGNSPLHLASRYDHMAGAGELSCVLALPVCSPPPARGDGILAASYEWSYETPDLFCFVFVIEGSSFSGVLQDHIPKKTNSK